MLKDTTKDKEKPIIEKAIRETLGHRPYSGVHNSTCRIQI